ncbi:hypothetical protein BH23BAC2_BH23BAC2_10430 [soil metagenome]
MRHLKTFAFALAIMICSTTFAAKEKPKSKISNSAEFERLLKDASLDLDRDYLGKVIFSVNEEKGIVVHAILSNEEFVRNYISEKLTHQFLTGSQWQTGKIYYLPVKMNMEN